MNRFSQIINQYFRYLAALEIVLIVGLLGFYVLYPKYTEVQETGAFEIGRLQETANAKQTELNQLQTMHEELTQLNVSQLIRLERALPTALDAPVLMEQVEQAFSNQNYIVRSIDVVEAETVAVAPSAGPVAAPAGAPATAQPTPTQPFTGVKKINLTVNIAGDTAYEGLKDFLSALSGAQPVLLLDQVSYTPELDSYAVILSTYVAE